MLSKKSGYSSPVLYIHVGGQLLWRNGFVSASVCNIPDILVCVGCRASVRTVSALLRRVYLSGCPDESGSAGKWLAAVRSPAIVQKQGP
jgi:hypothetical protein